MNVVYAASHDRQNLRNVIESKCNLKDVNNKTGIWVHLHVNLRNIEDSKLKFLEECLTQLDQHINICLYLFSKFSIEPEFCKPVF